MQIQTQVITKTSTRTTVVASFMLAISATAVVFSWGMLSVLGLSDLASQSVKMATLGVTEPITSSAYFLTNILADKDTKSDTGQTQIFNQTLQDTNTATLKATVPIYSITAKGTVTLDAESSYLRIMAGAYPVFKTDYVVFGPGTYTFTDFCAETCLIPEGLTINQLTIQAYQASLNLETITYDTSLPKLTKTKSDIQLTQELTDINNLNQQIQVLGLEWTAGSTEVTKQPWAKQTSYLTSDKTVTTQKPYTGGLEYYVSGIWSPVSKGKPGTKDGESENFPASLDPFIPDNFDWRSRHGQDWITSIKNQGDSGICGYFADIGTIEAQINLYYNNPNLDVDLSEEYSWSCLTRNNLGNYISPGVVTEACFPHEIYQNDIPKPCGESCQIDSPNWEQWGVLETKQVDYPPNAVLQEKVDTIKEYLMNNGPLSIDMSWGGGDGHALVLIGWHEPPDQSRTIWIIKNSWGNWGGEEGTIGCPGCLGCRCCVSNCPECSCRQGIGFLDMPVEWLSFGIDYFVKPTKTSGPSPDRLCTDKDADNYCFWGTSDRPASCATNPADGIGINCCPASCNAQYADFDDSKNQITCHGCPQCSDQADNDSDGKTDYPADPQCTSLDDLTETADCGDSLDNDKDGLSDYPNDPGCSSANDVLETNSKIQCDDGIENDDDGRFDFCVGQDCILTGAGCDGIDNCIPNQLNRGCLINRECIINRGDYHCDSLSDPSESLSAITECSDGISNDSDQFIDYCPPELIENKYSCYVSDGVCEYYNSIFDWASYCQSQESCEPKVMIGCFVGNLVYGDPGCSSYNDSSELNSEVACDDGIDNDGDSTCDFAGCNGLPRDLVCSSPSATDENSACSDGIDNDGDSTCDFAGCNGLPPDKACSRYGSNSESYTNIACDDAIDNDGDGTCDFRGCNGLPADPGCFDERDNSEIELSIQCDDDIDNDNDEEVDFPDDSDCESPADLIEHVNECIDGINNDYDDKVDQEDPGCGDPQDYTETSSIDCDDGVNNDYDFLIDMQDPGCYGLEDPGETNPFIQCDDGVDNDNNTLMDADDAASCSSPQDITESSVLELLLQYDLTGDPLSSVAADFNNDGQIDLSVGTTNGVYIFTLNNCLSANNCTSKILWKKVDIGQVNALAAADFNGDGLLDIAAGTSQGLRVITQADPACRENCEVKYLWDNVGNIIVRNVSIIDFNDDGQLDVAVLDYSGLQVISKAVSDCQENCLTRILWKKIGDGADDLAVGDFNNDKRLDIAVEINDDLNVFTYYDTDCQENCQIKMLWQKTGAGRIHSMAAADMNNDGKLDIIAGKNNGINVFIAPNCQDSSACEAKILWNYDTNEIKNLAVADFNNDNQLDVASFHVDTMLNYAISIISQTNLACQENCETKVLWEARLGGFVKKIVITDIDNDNILEVVTDSTFPGLNILVQEDINCSENCRSKILWKYEGNELRNPIFADFNNDGSLDLAIGKNLFTNLGKSGKAPWPMANHDIWNTNQYGFVPPLSNQRSMNFKRGDTNQSGTVDIADAITLLNYLFSTNKNISCLKSADINDSGAVDIADAIYLLKHLFAQGSAPKLPFDTCGVDPTPDDLTCESFVPCQ